MDYANDPELSGKYLGTITKDFAIVADTLKEASYQIRRNDIKYPIFIFSRVPVPFGSLLLSPEEVATEWYVLASYLDVFVQQGLVAEELVEDFQRAYKDPDEFCCLFVVDGEFTKFVFVPYPED
ncbi:MULTISPECIES: hypothetical protein [Hymenobacter]|uniref:Uncharacterized protein n=2 Tax=Hymenobacter TaxID=89966 RepID=A0A328B914_9BACT|nr:MULTISPECIES: hypothetical protein [Hymenobacter]RAK63447.1 hypothetical protein DLM85_20800 [Hymenobacter edaphi]TLM89829.1 hypothetical protein FDY95_19690 [Hymenobacter jeollabukensis]